MQALRETTEATRPTARTARSTNRPAEQSRLHRALRNAAKIYGLKDAVLCTGTTLICFIPKDAPAPISPVQAQRLADERGCDVRTTRNHISTLIRLGLAQDECLDGGGRCVVRAANGTIAVLHGISFAPLLAMAEELEEKVARMNALATEMQRYRSEISTLRRKLKPLVAHSALSDADRAYYEKLPRRIASLDLCRLRNLWSGIVNFRARVDALIEDSRAGANAVSPKEESDRSENSTARSYTTTDLNIDSCNSAMPAEKKGGNRPSRPTCGLEHVTLRMALNAAPDEWHVLFERYGAVDWASFVNVAYERKVALGINDTAWALAQAALDRTGAAILVLLADANDIARGGIIFKPGAWVRRMAEKAERGEAHLHRSIFGILNREGTVH